MGYMTEFDMTNSFGTDEQKKTIHDIFSKVSSLKDMYYEQREQTSKQDDRILRLEIYLTLLIIAVVVLATMLFSGRIWQFASAI